MWGGFFLLPMVDFERVRFAVPELLELNGTAPAPVQLRMVSERCERIAM